MAKFQSITSLPRSPEEDRHARMVKYAIMMGIRLVCIFVCLVVPGYWIIIPAIGAVVLPYIAVVIANVSTSNATAARRPEQLSITSTPTQNQDQDGPSRSNRG